MILFNLRQSFLFTLLTFFSVLTYAAPSSLPPWQIISADSSITFKATQNHSPLSGQFKQFKGEIYFDPAALKTSKVTIIIDMNSVVTSYKEVGDTLKSSDWFDIKLFPEATFKAEEFIQTEDNTYQAKGTLTIRDKTAPVTLIFTLNNYTNNTSRASGSTTIKRSAFLIGKGEWAKTDDIADEVTVNFILSAKRNTETK